MASNNLNYIIEKVLPKDFEDLMGNYYELRIQYQDQNREKFDELYRRLIELKSGNRLKSLYEISAATFYDLRVSFLMGNKMLMEIFGISKYELSKLSQFYNVYADRRQYLAEMMYGARLIDVEKFIEYLTKG